MPFFYYYKHEWTHMCLLTGQQGDPGAWAGLCVAGADVRVQTHAAAAPEAADRAGKQAEGRDGWAQAPAAKRSRDPSQQHLYRTGTASQEAGCPFGEGGKSYIKRNNTFIQSFH